MKYGKWQTIKMKVCDIMGHKMRFFASDQQYFKYYCARCGDVEKRERWVPKGDLK